MAHQGRAVRPQHLAAAFARNPTALRADYANALEELEFISRGFLTGSIDLVFTDGEDPRTARWWVADWKSNWIGERDNAGRPLHCGPRHYTQAAMEDQMRLHHYPLQAHLYLVALHRFLQWRLDDYQPDAISVATPTCSCGESPHRTVAVSFSNGHPCSACRSSTLCCEVTREPTTAGQRCTQALSRGLMAMLTRRRPLPKQLTLEQTALQDLAGTHPRPRSG